MDINDYLVIEIPTAGLDSLNSAKLFMNDDVLKSYEELKFDIIDFLPNTF